MIFNVIRKLPPKIRAHAALAQVIVGASKRWWDLNVGFSRKCGGECLLPIAPPPPPSPTFKNRGNSSDTR